MSSNRISSEMRSIDFEVRPTKEGGSLPKSFNSAAFYYVCEDVGGNCLYFRQDLEVTLAQ